MTNSDSYLGTKRVISSFSLACGLIILMIFPIRGQRSKGESVFLTGNVKCAMGNTSFDRWRLNDRNFRSLSAARFALKSEGITQAGIESIGAIVDNVCSSQWSDSKPDWELPHSVSGKPLSRSSASLFEVKRITGNVEFSVSNIAIEATGQSLNTYLKQELRRKD